MKKLFTLIALLTCFIGAKAVTVVDAEIDFSKETSVHFFSWGGQGQERWSLENGCLHYLGTEATANAWDVQVFPIGGFETDPGVTYTLTIKLKGDHSGNIFNYNFLGSDHYGAIPVTTEFTEYVKEEEAGGTSGDLLFQCGDWVGTIDIAYMKVTHEEREQRPVEWVNMLVNGDAEGEYGDPACAQSVEFGRLFDETGVNPLSFPTDIITMKGIDGTDTKVFASHAKAVNPVIVWDSDGEQWGVAHSAGDPKDDNQWQNQFFITLPRALKDGEQIKIAFDYMGSDVVRAHTQVHALPQNYIAEGNIGDINFTTGWQHYEKQLSATAGMQSLAFNLGAEVYDKDMEFYFDNLQVCTMKLDEGVFMASANTVSGLVEYDFDNALELTYDEDIDALVGVAGTVGNQDSWVNELMISTVRGNDKAFKAATLKYKKAVKNDPDDWFDYEEAAQAKIKLPVSGVWQVSVDTVSLQMNFVKLEGEADKDPIVIVANPTEIVVKGQERQPTATEQPADEEAGIAAGTGQPWDNQFFIKANRTLAAGEETYIEFDYVATKEAKVSTQAHGEPGAYINYEAIGDVNFTTEEQHFTMDFTVPANSANMQSIAFNMAEIKDACDYTIKNVIWKMKDDSETLIDMTGTTSFFVKEGVGDATHEFGTTTGINTINNTVVRSGKYLNGGNLIIVRDGKAYNVAGVSVK